MSRSAQEGRSVAATRPVPRLARLLLQRLVDRDSVEFIVGDLDEAFRREVEEGKPFARLRYWRLAIASIWSRRAPRRNSGPPGDGPHQPGGRRSSGWANDVRFAARLLRKSPAFTALAVLTLALGIGASTVVFSVLNGVLLRPLPYQRPAELVNVWQVYYEWQDSDVPLFRTMAERFPVSYPVFLAWQRQGHAFEDVAAYAEFNAIVDGPDLAEWVPTAEASSSLFDVLGVDPQVGRGFLPEDDVMGADRVVVLSHTFWMRRFAGDPGVIGEQLTLTGASHTIIGVMPPGFYFPDRTQQLWVVLRDSHRTDRWTRQSLDAVARIRDGLSIPTAQRDMDAVTLQILEANPDSPEVGIRLIGRVDEIVGATATTLVLLMAAVGLVLLVTAANLAGLLLVRATGRRQEIAVRRALGASRMRLLGQLFTESALLAFAGGGLGILLTAWGLRSIKLLLPESIPRTEDIVVDARVLVFAAGVSLLIACLFGVTSVLRSGGHRLADSLRASGAGAIGAGQRGRAILVIAEVSIAVVLLIGATLLVSSYTRLSGASRGFDESNVLTFNMSAPVEDWEDPERLVAFFDRAVTAISRLPGVESVATVSSLPFSGGQSSASFGTVDNSDGESDAWSLEEIVGSAYFDTLGLTLLRGRLFDSGDTATSERVQIINQRLAEEYWSDTDPIGEFIWEDGVPFRIIGVVGNNKHRSLTEDIERMRYRVDTQTSRLSTSIVVRTAVPPGSIAGAVRGVVADVGAGATISEVASMASLVARTTSLARFRSLSLASLAGVAVVLAVLGVYGVIALSVASRRREIGVRMTLGAARGNILRQVLGSGVRLVVPGVAVGIAMASMAVRLIESYVYEIPTTDPLTFAGVAVFVGLVALLATFIPARRATRIEPLIVLRSD